jgi:DNA polymerase-3 subunit alpha
MIEKFAGYGFNKSHSTAYAKIAYMTAYLKAHFPLEFMAALLCGDTSGRNFKTKDSLVEHLEDCRRMGIPVAPPDVNASYPEFTVSQGKILFALTAIKGCGQPAAKAILQARQAGGPFRDLFDFCERVDPTHAHRGTLEALIKAGAFDSTTARRAACFAAIERGLQLGAASWNDRRCGQKSLFAALDDDPQAPSAALPDVPEWDEKQKLAYEKEVLGFYFSSHPLAEHEATFATYCTHNTVEAAAQPHRTEVHIGGLLSAIKFSHTKNPRPGQTATRYAMFDLEDTAGIIRCIMWPELFAQQGHLVQPDAVLVVRGVVEKRSGGDEATLIVNELIELETLSQRYTRGVLLRIDEERHGLKGLETLYEILRAYPGELELQLQIVLANRRKVWLVGDGIRVRPEPEMRQRVEQLLGPGHFRLLTSPPKPVPAGQGNGRNGRKWSARES